MDTLKSMCKGTIIAIAISIVSILIFAICEHINYFLQKSINTIIIIISGVSLLIGTSISSIKLKKYGIINGIVISVIYMIILYLASSFVNNDFSINSKTIYMLITGSVLGILGGIIGVNIKHQR